MAGRPDRLTALVTRVTAPNPGPFTYTGTCTYLIGDARGVAVVDPGPRSDEHLRAVLAAAPGPVAKVLVTHTHLDHSANARALAEATGAPVLGCAPHAVSPGDAPPALDLGADFQFRPDRALADGEAILLPSCTITAVATPGHTGNHLAFAVGGGEDSPLLTGDHVMGWSTSVVAPPDGDMAAYLRSLDRLLARDDTAYLPGHGPPIHAPRPFVAALREHRQARDDAILAALERGPATPDEIVALVYDGLAPALRVAASLNVLAHLEMHQGAGEVARRGAVYALASR